MIKKVKNNFNGRELLERSVEKNCKNQIKKTEKVIKIKGDKSYVRWKSYDNSFNSWINEKNIV